MVAEMIGLPHPLIDRNTAKDLLREVAPYWTEFLETLEESRGQLAFRPEFVDAIASLKIDAYPRLYETESVAGNLIAVAMMGTDEAEEFDAALLGATPEERGAAMTEVGARLDMLEGLFDFGVDLDAKGQAAQAFEALAPEAQSEAIRFAQNVFMGVLVVLHQQLSILVHGERLSTLVARAKSGDDDAFLRAIQIDKRILTKIPYFEARFIRAHLQDERRFRTAISRKLEAPPYAGKIVHKKLWLAFALLDGVGLLEAYDGNDLLDLLHEVGVIDDEHPIDDVKNLHKLKARYREFQVRGGLSTP